MMKSVKFLAALCIAAMLVSCAKDEYIAQDEFQQKDEYVGADLIGTNVSMTVGFGADTKISNGRFESTDRLGLAWLVAGNYGSTQVDGNKKPLPPTNSNLYANHMFYLDGADFTSKGNIYQGWHFAYFPYVYELEPGKVKQVDVNPVQKLKGLKASRNEMLHLSAREFLTKDHLNADMQLEFEEGEGYVVEHAFSVIGVKVTPSETFTSSETLKNSKIESITLNADKRAIGTNNIFATKVNVQASKLDILSKNDDENTSTDAKYELLQSFSEVLVPTELKETLTTTVKNDEINLSETQELRFFVVPQNVSSSYLTEDDIKITVAVEGGQFNIEYKYQTNSYTLTASDKVNNLAIEALVDAYTQDGTKYGALTNTHGGSAGVRGVSLDLSLSKADFVEDFTGISSASEWNQAVNIANDLNRTSVLFNLDGKIEIEEGVELLLPNATKFNVETKANSVNAGVYVNRDYTMTKAMAAALSGEYKDGAGVKHTKNNLVVVKEGATLTLVADDKNTTGEDANEAAELHVGNLTNAGTINLGYHSTISNLYNEGARVNVVYGSYINNIKSTSKGIIAYIATGNDSAAEINELMTETASGAQSKIVAINTIVVNDGVAFSLESAYAGNSEYNNGSTLNEQLLENITVEMNGGTLVDGTVKDVKVMSGDNNILKDVFASNLYVNDGSVTVKSEEVSGVTKDIQYDYIYNSSTLVANTDIYTIELTTYPDSETYAENGVGIYYNHGTSQDGKLYGKVQGSVYGSGNVLPNVVKVTTPKAFTDILGSNSKNIKLGADITLSASSSSDTFTGFDITGKVIDGNGYSISTANKPDHGKTDGVFVVDGSEETIVRNVVFNAPNTQYDIKIVLTAGTTPADITIDGCDFTTATAEKVGAGKRGIYVEGYTGTMTVKNCTFDDKVYAFNISNAACDNGTFKFENCNLNGWLSGHGKNEFTNCTFGKSGSYQNYIPYNTAKFTDCKFDEGFVISVKHGRSFEFNNCTRGYVAVAHPSNLKWDISGSGADWTDSSVNSVSISAKVNASSYTGTVLEYKEGDEYDTVKLEWN